MRAADFGLDQHQVAAEIAEVVDQPVGAGVGRNVLEDIVGRRAGVAPAASMLRGDALFDAIPFAREHMEAVDAAAPFPAVAV